MLIEAPTRYDDKLKALVEYAAAVGWARLSDSRGNVVIAGDRTWYDALEEDVARTVVPVEAKSGAYTLHLYPLPGMVPLAVAKRMEGCMRLLRVLPPIPPSMAGGGRGGSGPAHAELRVWPLAKRTRS